MSGAGELKVYRAPFICLAPAWVGSACFFVVGLSMVTIGPSQHGGTLSVVVGALALLFSLWLGAVLATNRLIVTPAGLVIGRNNGSVLVTNVVSFTRRYPARIANELSAWQRQLAPATPGKRP